VKPVSFFWSLFPLAIPLTLSYTVPAVVVGIIFGPYAARFLDATEWGSAIRGQQDAITLVGTAHADSTTYLTCAGYVSGRDRGAAAHRGISTACQVSAASVERDVCLPHSKHDTHVALHFGLCFFGGS
jgi:hypothetical protein